MYQPGGSQADEIIIEFDFMWSGQQVEISVAPGMCLMIMMCSLQPKRTAAVLERRC